MCLCVCGGCVAMYTVYDTVGPESGNVFLDKNSFLRDISPLVDCSSLHVYGPISHDTCVGVFWAGFIGYMI